MNISSVIKVEKIYNKYNLDRVKGELIRLLAKYPDKCAFDLVKHLFHGTRQNPPSNIYACEDGLDMRYSANGANGYGIYFANNSAYSNSYRSAVGQHFQMFMCLVLTGESTN
jgi:hypothetical protein